MQDKLIMKVLPLLTMLVVQIMLVTLSYASTFKPLIAPPLEEHRFGIYAGKDRVGYYTQKFTKTTEGYKIDATSSVKLTVMGFSKDSTTKEVYWVDKDLSMRSFDISQTINGVYAHVTGNKYDSGLRVRIEKLGKTIHKQAKFTRHLIPGPALNIFPMMQDSFIGKTFKVHTFDPEELKIKAVKISVFKEEKAPDGQSAIKMRNTLYPFVYNDIWIDVKGNTLWESVRDGLVVTKYEISRLLERIRK